MIHPRRKRFTIPPNRKVEVEMPRRVLITVPCWECRGMRVTDDGHCKVCFGKGTVVVEPNPLGMNPEMGPGRN